MITADKKIRLLYLYPALPVGGAEKQLYVLLKHLDKDRYEPYVCCLFREGPVADMIRGLGVPVLNCTLGHVYDIRAIGRIRKILCEKQIDILHTCLFGFDLFANIAARISKTKVIISSRRECASWKKIHHLILQYMANMFVDTVVVNSVAVRDFVAKQEHLSLDRLKVIYNGIETDVYAGMPDVQKIKAELSLSADVPIVGVVSNFGTAKGHRYLVEAARIVRQVFPRVLFLLVGEGPMRQDTEDFAQSQNVLPAIRFLGPRSDIPRILSVCNVFAFPSLTEGFPNVIMEALCAGVPIVATNVGGVPELIESGKNGILVHPRDVEALSQGIIRLLTDQAFARQLAVNGRTKIKERCDARTMAGSYEALYDSLCSLNTRT